jgi:nitrogen regulatory protein PII
MKELNIVIPHENLSDVNSILYKHEVGGMNSLKVASRGHAERQAIEQLPMRDTELAQAPSQNSEVKP